MYAAWTSRSTSPKTSRRPPPRCVLRLERCEDRLPPGQIFGLFTDPLGDPLSILPGAPADSGNLAVQARATNDDATGLRAELGGRPETPGLSANGRPSATVLVPAVAAIETTTEEVLTQAVAAWAGLPFDHAHAFADGSAVSRQGTLEVLGALREDGSGDELFLLNMGGQSIPLVGHEALHDLASGAVLSVRGTMSAGSLAVAPDGLTVLQEPPPVADDGGAGVTENRYILVINFNFQNNPTQPWTMASVNNLFNNTITNWYLEGSYGQLIASADVAGWFTLATTPTTCAYSNWATMAQNAARAAGYEPNLYNHVVYAFPRVGVCGWSGLGQVPGRFTWLNGAMNHGVAVHELGHNLGLSHSRSLRCSTGPLSGTCSTMEYGDLFDSMGSASGRHHHASYRSGVGWIGAGDRFNVSPAHGEIVVALRSAAAPEGTRIMRVERTGQTGNNQYLYVETREAVGFDSALSQYPLLINGVAIYLGGTNLRSQSIVDFGYTTSGRNDAPLPIGQVLFDYAGDLVIYPYQKVSGETYVYVGYGLG